MRVKGGFEGERLKKKKEREDGKDQDVKKVRGLSEEIESERVLTCEHGERRERKEKIKRKKR